MNRETRRQFLKSAGALGAASLLPACAGSGGGEARGRLIDTHHHFYAPAYQKAWLDWEDARKIPHFQTQVNWSRAGALEANAADARSRVDAEGNRVRLRHAESRRRRAADELRRSLAGRLALPADLRGAQPAQSGRLLPSARRLVLRAALGRHLPGGDRSAARHDARGDEPASLGQLRAPPRHQVALLARRRHGADARRAHRVLLQLPQGPRDVRARGHRARIPAPLLRHRERHRARLDGGAAQARARHAGDLRQRLSLRADGHPGGLARDARVVRHAGARDRKRQRDARRRRSSRAGRVLP